MVGGHGGRKGCLVQYLEISELRELLETAVESAGEGLVGSVNGLVSDNVAALAECLAADVTRIGALPGVTALMGLSSGRWGLDAVILDTREPLAVP